MFAGSYFIFRNVIAACAYGGSPSAEHRGSVMIQCRRGTRAPGFFAEPGLEWE